MCFSKAEHREFPGSRPSKCFIRALVAISALVSASIWHWNANATEEITLPKVGEREAQSSNPVSTRQTDTDPVLSRLTAYRIGITTRSQFWADAGFPVEQGKIPINKPPSSSAWRLYDTKYGREPQNGPLKLTYIIGDATKKIATLTFVGKVLSDIEFSNGQSDAVMQSVNEMRGKKFEHAFYTAKQGDEELSFSLFIPAGIDMELKLNFSESAKRVVENPNVIPIVVYMPRLKGKLGPRIETDAGVHQGVVAGSFWIRKSHIVMLLNKEYFDTQLRIVMSTEAGGDYPPISFTPSKLEHDPRLYDAYEELAQ